VNAPVRASAIATLAGWQPPDPGQDALRHAVLAFLHARPDSCRRSCEPGHITASTLVVDDTTGRILLTLHPRLGRWVQLGGHCEDADTDIVAAALREATEESGIDAAAAATGTLPTYAPAWGVTDSEEFAMIAAALGLAPGWLLRGVSAVGNYAEIYERNLGKGSTLGLERGPNRLWQDGGLMQAPPLK